MLLDTEAITFCFSQEILWGITWNRQTNCWKRELSNTFAQLKSLAITVAENYWMSEIGVGSIWLAGPLIIMQKCIPFWRHNWAHWCKKGVSQKPVFRDNLIWSFHYDVILNRNEISACSLCSSSESTISEQLPIVKLNTLLLQYQLLLIWKC